MSAACRGRATKGRPAPTSSARTVLERAAAFIARQAAAGAAPAHIVRATRSAWPDLTTGELLQANADALRIRHAAAASDAEAIAAAARLGKAGLPSSIAVSRTLT